MNKEILEIINELSKKPTGELALCLAESEVENIDLQNRIDKAVELLLDKYVRGLLNDNEVNNIVKILKGDNK